MSDFAGVTSLTPPSTRFRSAVSTRVYQFGLLPPTREGDRVREQMRLAHRYKNDLTQIERGRRAAVRELNATVGDVATAEMAAREADDVVAAAARAIKQARSRTRSRSETKVMNAALADAKVARKEAMARLVDLRRQLRDRPDLVAATKQIEEMANELRRSVRAHGGVYWGTYSLVEAACDQARKDTPIYDGAEPNDPSFRRYDGTGRVGVQIQAGLSLPQGITTDELFSGRDLRVQIDPVNGDVAWSSPSRGDRRRASRTALRIRIGSNDDRSPIWAEWPMVLHRELPAGVVKNVAVSRRMRGPHERWTCEITVTQIAETRRRAETGAVAVHVGWRRIVGGLRVSTWLGSDGESGQLVLQDEQLASLTYADELRSTRDTGFNAARDALKAAIATPADVPEWLTLATKTLAQWRSAGRLASLARRWKTNRFDGDADAYAAVETWRYHDHHLWEWECSQRQKAERHRREVYRLFAAEMSARYRTVVLSDFDLREVAKKRPLGEERGTELPQSNRKIAAVSTLRDALKNAFAESTKVSSVDITKTCHGCGSIEDFDAKTMIHHACTACGAVWDQDENAAKNMMTLHEASERTIAEQPNGVARVSYSTAIAKESKWTRLKREKVEKRGAAPLANPDAGA